jgi:hypothetical protein
MEAEASSALLPKLHLSKSPLPRPPRWRPLLQLPQLEASPSLSSHKRHRPRRPRTAVTMSRRQYLEPSLAPRQVPPSRMQWSGASVIVPRRSRTSTTSWMRRASSKLRRVTSLGPHPSPSNPYLPHNPSRSQHTATTMLSRIIQPHRRKHVVFTLLWRLTLCRTIPVHRRYKTTRSIRLLSARPPHTIRHRKCPKLGRLNRSSSSMRRLSLLRDRRRAQDTRLRGR